MNREKVIEGLECHKIDNNHRINCADCSYYVNDNNHIECINDLHGDAIALIKEQDSEIRQLRLALNIAKGTCKGIKVEER